MLFKRAVQEYNAPTNIFVIGGKYDGNAYSSGRYLYEQIKREITSRYLTEALDFEISGDETGGTIVFSTDVNAVPMSKNKIVNWVKQKVATLNNRITATNKIDKVAQNNDLVGWTIGKGLSGRYTAKNGKAFGENSVSVDLVGISTDKLLKIATELCNLFNQESVLVKDYNTQKVYFVNGD